MIRNDLFAQFFGTPAVISGQNMVVHFARVETGQNIAHFQSMEFLTNPFVRFEVGGTIQKSHLWYIVSDIYFD